MDKRKTENTRVRKSIEDAFFSLLKEKNFSQITVTDLVTEAHVARASYYRNFACREDIVRGYIHRLRENTGIILHQSPDIFSTELSRKTLSVHISSYLKEKDNILLLYNNGFGTLMLEETDRYVEESLGDMPCTSTERYRLYFISGAIFNSMMQWLKTGARETPDEMAAVIMELLKQITKENITYEQKSI